MAKLKKWERKYQKKYSASGFIKQKIRQHDAVKSHAPVTLPDLPWETEHERRDDETPGKPRLEADA